MVYTVSNRLVKVSIFVFVIFLFFKNYFSLPRPLWLPAVRLTDPLPFYRHSRPAASIHTDWRTPPSAGTLPPCHPCCTLLYRYHAEGRLPADNMDCYLLVHRLVIQTMSFIHSQTSKELMSQSQLITFIELLIMP